MSKVREITELVESLKTAIPADTDKLVIISALAHLQLKFVGQMREDEDWLTQNLPQTTGAERAGSDGLGEV